MVALTGSDRRGHLGTGGQAAGRLLDPVVRGRHPGVQRRRRLPPARARHRSGSFVGTTTVVQIGDHPGCRCTVTVATPEQGVAAGGELGYLPPPPTLVLAEPPAVLITLPKAPVDNSSGPCRPMVLAPGQPPNIIRARSGGRRVDAVRRPVYGSTIHAAVVHHRGSNDYAPEGLRVDRAVDLRLPPAPWAGATSPTNALVDKYGQVFEGGRAESPRMSWDLTPAGSTATWGVSMIGDFEDAAHRTSRSRRSAACWAGG